MPELGPEGFSDFDVTPEIDKPEEECAVFGVHAPNHDVATLAYYGLRTMTHRGQEAAGIAVSTEDGSLYVNNGVGRVDQVFSETDIRALDSGHSGIAVAHNRYGTKETKQDLATRTAAAGPSYRDVGAGREFVLSHNGNVTNTAALKLDIMGAGASVTDSHDIADLIAHDMQTTGDLEKSLRNVLPQLEGAFSLVISDGKRLYGIRDPRGIRPLSIGLINGDREPGWVLASETAALYTVGVKMDTMREVQPGEMVVVDENGPESFNDVFEPEEIDPKLCLFEFIYFSRPDSVLYGENVKLARERLGAKLAELDEDLEADVVIGVPESGIPASKGYSWARGIKHDDGFVKSRNAGRTFINPTQEMRELGVRLKLQPLSETVRDKKIVVVDDSIVRGTTTKKTMAMLREAGAAEIHLRVSSPPYMWPCVYGIDTGRRGELLAAQMSVDEMAEHLGVDSIKYLTIDQTYEAIGIGEEDARPFCDGCLTGNYPASPSDNDSKSVPVSIS